jgi:hypothetical protein
MDLQQAISDYGKTLAAKLSSPAITGAPEYQLRGPLEHLIVDGLAPLCGYGGKVKVVDETPDKNSRTRPDYAVTLGKALIGFIEVKAPGKGANPRSFSDPHDKEQFKRLSSLPNLLYTDGNSFSLWRDGEMVGKPVHLDGDVTSSGAKLKAPQELVALFTDFFTWAPIAPKTPQKLAEISARLCRLLRDEVAEELERGNTGLAGLKDDWRKLLFPEATDKQFADGYAQAVTFGLLIARTRDISLKDGIDHAANELKKSNSLIGTALDLLVDDPANHQALKTSLDTMTRVLNEVNWLAVAKSDPDAWLYFYEHFLEVYDNKLRKLTGSYYTPPEVVTAMVRLVDEALRGPLFNRPQGLAASDVTIADPAVGTGTFLLGVLRKIAETVEADMGPGSVPGAISAAAQRLIGFELQFGPFAVAQLRLIAEMQELMTAGGSKAPVPELKLFITDTLGNPYVEDENLLQIVQPIARSRREANKIKREEKITVVIGNPPYKNKADGLGGWIESGSNEDRDIQAPMDRWMPPREWGVGAQSHHLKNLYVFFWRWASWKVFGSGKFDSTGIQDEDEEGIVAFITASGFLGGPGFQKMRADLRASCSDIWIIDCSPEGLQPKVSTRVFEGVQQPICITIAARQKAKDQSQPSRVHYLSLASGTREEKFASLKALNLHKEGWRACSSGWRDPFLPEATGDWATFPTLGDMFHIGVLGSMPGRTWVIAPDRTSLAARWKRLVDERDRTQKEILFHPHLRGGLPGDKHLDKEILRGFPGHEARLGAVAKDGSTAIEPTRYAFRSFDRQWIIPDARLINQPSPTLWDAYGPRQVFMTVLDRTSSSSGPAVTFSGVVPDHDHYKGSAGGRVYPIWSDALATLSNIPDTILAHLADTYHAPVSPEDVTAYIAALLAHPAYTAHFQKDLKQPGLRVPLTTDPALFAEAVSLGREVIWLHTYGERFDDAAAGRPKAPPRLDKGDGPSIPKDGMIPPAPEPLPDTMDYDPATRRLSIGKGHIDNVMPEVWAYEVSGKNVLRQWFSYRKRDRTKPMIGDRRPPSPLDKIQPDGWLNDYTTDLMDLLHVLGRLVLLEPKQADLLHRILAQPLITVAELAPKTETAVDS